MNILCIGDIVGRPGREAVAFALPRIKKEHNIDFVIANAENASGGAGLIPKNADEILSYGVDVMTMGDHTWDKPDIFPYLQEHQDKIRHAPNQRGVDLGGKGEPPVTREFGRGPHQADDKRQEK